jgi:hypothetical protein
MPPRLVIKNSTLVTIYNLASAIKETSRITKNFVHFLTSAFSSFCDTSKYLLMLSKRDAQFTTESGTAWFPDTSQVIDFEGGFETRYNATCVKIDFFKDFLICSLNRKGALAAFHKFRPLWGLVSSLEFRY